MSLQPVLFSVVHTGTFRTPTLQKSCSWPCLEVSNLMFSFFVFVFTSFVAIFINFKKFAHPHFVVVFDPYFKKWGYSRVKWSFSHNLYLAPQEVSFLMCFKLFAVGHPICVWRKNSSTAWESLSVIYEAFHCIQYFLPEEWGNNHRWWDNMVLT